MPSLFLLLSAYFIFVCNSSSLLSFLCSLPLSWNCTIEDITNLHFRLRKKAMPNVVKRHLDFIEEKFGRAKRRYITIKHWKLPKIMLSLWQQFQECRLKMCVLKIDNIKKIFIINYVEIQHDPYYWFAKKWSSNIINTINLKKNNNLNDEINLIKIKNTLSL